MDEEIQASSSRSGSRLSFWWPPVALLIAAAALLLYRLGQPSLRADTIIFWNICRQSISPGQIVEQWMALMGRSGQFPLAMAVTRFFLILTGVEITQFTLRLPSVFWGLGSIATAWAIGRRLGGPVLAAVLAAILMLHPVFLQTCREAYFYPPMVLGSWLALLGLLMAVDVERKPCKTAAFVAVNAAGFGLLIYSQPTAWFSALVISVSVLAFEAWRSFKEKRIEARLVATAALYLIIGLPMVFVDWGLPQMREITQEAARAESAAVVAGSEGTLMIMTVRAIYAFAWGGTPLRLAFLGLVLLLCVLAYSGPLRKRMVCWVAPVLTAVIFLGYVAARSQSESFYEVRYLLALQPAYLVFLVLGLYYGPVTLVKGARAAVIAVALILLVAPAWAVLHLTGYPTPYREIQQWVDTNLPSGTPVLVDRWFEPWNELQVYPSTNVYFTFTVPNEPLHTFRQVRWHETAKQFFQTFPEAAYLEVAKTYQHVPDVGLWPWPAEHFRQHKTFANQPGLELRRLGMAVRGDYYSATTNRVVVDLYYNTREDIFEINKAKGLPVYGLYGAGWGYAKPNWRQGDFRDWRVLTGSAELELYNTTAAEQKVTVKLAAVAAGGAKQIESPTGRTDFPANELRAWTIGTFALPPGRTVIALQDTLGGLNTTPLLTASLTCEPIP